jgi:diguanylate cyclase (GGDEF)-like protein
MNKTNRLKTITKYVLYFLVLLTILNLGIIYCFQENNFSTALTDTVNFLLNLTTTLLLWLAYKHTKSLNAKRANGWAVLCLAQLLFAIGDTVWAIYETILDINPYPSIADLFYLAYYPLFLIGLLYLGQNDESIIRRINNGLDASIVFIVIGLFLGVNTFPQILAAARNETGLLLFLTLAYPLGDLILLSGLVILIYKREEEKFDYPFIFIAISVAIQIVADIIFSSQSLQETYFSGSWLDSGWVLGYFFLGIAAYLQSQSKTSKDLANSGNESLIHNGSYVRSTVRGNLPYLSIILAFGLLFYRVLNNELIYLRYLVGCLGILILLVLVRQFLVFWENDKLNENLSRTLKVVKSQAVYLQKTNLDLKNQIRERKKAEDQLAFDALHDSLTKLPNRVLLADRIQHVIDYSKRHKDHHFSVFFIDIDHFKNVNDSMGHAVGDELLVHFARRVQKCLRKSDTLARLGGDEFAILLENNSDSSQTEIIAERIKDVLLPPYSLSGKDFYVSASMGIVADTKDYTDSDSILQDADIAMYRAKMLGKARFVIFTPNLRTEAISRLDLEAQLQHAIEKDELFLNYQPIYSLSSNDLVGFEALLRWNNPGRGVLLPADFISIAEESDLIVKIGEWVLLEACRQLKQWQKNYPDREELCININISGRHFIHPNFIHCLESTTAVTGLKPKNIHLEITETVLVENREKARIVFTTLNNMGYEIQIDDFGTGYSSLGYLLNFHVDMIKIDKSFIQSIGKGENGDHLVKTIVNMAQELGIDIIAEGIETEQQLKDLKSMACKYGQGYLLSYPMASSGIDDLLQSGKKK